MKLTWLLALGALVTGSALAQTIVDGSDAEAIAAIARSYGTAELVTAADGTQRISGETRTNIPYQVFLLHCEAGKACEDLNFYAGFTGIKPTMDALNAWNRDKRFGSAYLDSDLDAAIEYDVNLDFGVTRENLSASFSLWSLLLGQYAEYIGYRPR